MSKSNPPFFFHATQSVDNRLADSFGFIWASYAGLRELWWQVRGFRSQFPDVHVNEIKNKFLSGLPMPGGIDLAKLCLNTEWLEHEQEFGKWILFEACTLYESWAEKVCSDIFPPKLAEQHAKNLQFPAGLSKSGKPKGYPLAVAAANATISTFMTAEFFPIIKASKLNRWSTVEDHLIAYRFFKDCRNSFIHSKGLASRDVIDARTLLETVQNKTPNPFRHKFLLPALSIQEPITLNIKDCILFATVVRLLICTFDAALCVSQASEAILEKRVRYLKTKKGAFLNLPSAPTKREQRIKRLLTAARIPAPVNLANVIAWMASNKII